MRVVRPDGASRLQGVVVPDNHRRQPVKEASEIAIIGGIDRDFSRRAVAEDVNARMRVQNRVGAGGVIPQQADEAV